VLYEKYTVRIQSEATGILRQMARESGLTVKDLLEIAAYNIIALYIKDKNQDNNPESPDADPLLDNVRKLDC